MQRYVIVLLSVVVLVLGAGVFADAKKKNKPHSHGIVTTQVTTTTSIPPGGFGGEIAFCPPGYVGVGGGVDPKTNAPQLRIGSAHNLTSAEGYSGVIASETSFTTVSVDIVAVCMQTSTAQAKTSAADREAARAELEEELREARKEER